MAVLLKTAAVRVSSIQIMQVRVQNKGKSVWKSRYDGDVSYGVHFATKKLKPYFQEHPITVVCTAPLAKIIGNRDASSQVAKWAIELAPYSIFY